MSQDAFSRASDLGFVHRPLLINRHCTFSPKNITFFDHFWHPNDLGNFFGTKDAKTLKITSYPAVGPNVDKGRLQENIITQENRLKQIRTHQNTIEQIEQVRAHKDR